MPSTFSTNLKIELMATGENSGTWGTVTNTNLGTALEQAVVGYGNPNYSSDANLTITLTDSNAAQAARALVLNVTSSVSLTGTRELVVPTIQKQYIVQNNTTGSQSITVKTSAGTGITIPNGKKMHVYVDGTNVVQMDDFALIFNVDNLTLDGNTLSSTDTNGNIVIAPNGTGDVQLDADTIRVGDSAAAVTLTSNGAGALTVTTGGAADLVLNTNSGTNSGSITIGNSTNGNITVATNGTGDFYVDADTVRIGDSNANATLTTNGTGDLILNTNSGTNSGSITIEDGVNGNIIIAPNGTGQVQITNASLDLTTIEVSNINAKDGTAAITLTDSTGAVTVSTALTANGGAVFNENGADVDFRVEGDTDANLFFVDASTDRVGIGTSSPTQKLDVNGIIRAYQTTSSAQVLAGNTGGVIIIARDSSTGSNFGSAYSANIYCDGAYPLLFWTDNAEKMRLTSGGQLNLGGNFTSTNNTLQVTGNAAIGYTTAAPTTGLIVAGNVGVGTDSPAVRLDVTGAGRFNSSGEALTVGASTLAANTAQYFRNTSGYGVLALASASDQYLNGVVAGDFVIGSNAKSLRFGNAGTGALGATLDSSGNLGIGTSSPAYKLDVNGNANIGSTSSVDTALFVKSSTVTGLVGAQSNYSAWSSGGLTTAMNIGTTTNNGISFGTNNIGRLNLDSSGNLGLGVTPSAWKSNYKALEVGRLGNAFWGQTDASGVFVSSNAYLNSATQFIYANTAVATYYTQNSGQHQWYTAPSGTAGNAITFTQAMTLDASGNLVIGNTSASAKLDVNSAGTVGRFACSGADLTLSLIQSSANPVIVRMTNNSNNWWDTQVNTDNSISWDYKDSEKARITSGGEFLVAKTAASVGNVGFEALPSGFIASTMAASTNAADTLNVYSTGASAYRFYVQLDGKVNATNTTIAAISDQRLKENIRDLDVGLDAIMALKPRKFDWKAGKGKDIKDDRGFVAQEFEQVFPDMIDNWKDPAPEGEEPYKSVRADLIPVLVKAIQEQQAMINELKAEVAALKGV